MPKWTRFLNNDSPRHCEEERRSNPLEIEVWLGDCFVPRNDGKPKTMYKLIFLLLKQRLNSKIPAIKEVTRRSEGKGHMKISPAVHIVFLPTEMASLGNGIQEGVVEFEVILKSDNLADDDKRYTQSPPDHDAYVDLIHQHLSGYSGWLSDLEGFEDLKGTTEDLKIFNTVDRIRVDPDRDVRAIRRTVQTFRCYVKDYTGNKKWQKVVRGLEIYT